MEFKRYQLNSRVINDLKKRSTFGIIFYLMVAYLVLFAHGYVERHPSFSFKFLFWVHLICIFRFVHLPVAHRMSERFETLNTWIFLASVVLTGLIWGVGFAKFLLLQGEAQTRFLMTVCSIGLCSGGVVAFIPYLPLSNIYLLALLLPATLTLFFLGLDIPLGIALSLFMIYLCFVTLRGNREYWDALENEYLLEIRSRKLETISRIDGLTGLYNRRYFDEYYQKEWRRSLRQHTPLSIILFDIDFFKQINDRYGHLAGDEYLKFISDILNRVFRRTTDLAARYGGEEFIILMPEHHEKAIKAAESVRELMESETLFFEGHSIQTTISAGVVTAVSEKDDHPDNLISKADEALYLSKKNGRNRVTELIYHGPGINK